MIQQEQASRTGSHDVDVPIIRHYLLWVPPRAAASIFFPTAAEFFLRNSPMLPELLLTAVGGDSGNVKARFVAAGDVGAGAAGAGAAEIGNRTESEGSAAAAAASLRPPPVRRDGGEEVTRSPSGAVTNGVEHEGVQYKGAEYEGRGGENNCAPRLPTGWMIGVSSSGEKLQREFLRFSVLLVFRGRQDVVPKAHVPPLLASGVGATPSCSNV